VTTTLPPHVLAAIERNAARAPDLSPERRGELRSLLQAASAPSPAAEPRKAS
jgi:hypothetical protein